MKKRGHVEVIREHLSLEGAALLDVGCGNGALAKKLSKIGCWAVGLESSSGQLERARESGNASRVVCLQGLGQILPFADGSFDYVLFFNSLHHVPVEEQEAALSEALRVARPGGLIYVAEPLAEGSNFEASREIEDETEVRAAAQAAISKMCLRPELTRKLQERYLVERRFADFAVFAQEMIAVDENRRAVFATKEPEIRSAFLRHASEDDKGYLLEQPMTLSVLTKVG